MEAGVFVAGRVLKTELIEGQRGDGRAYSFLKVYILADVEVLECNVARAWTGPTPQKGQEGIWEIGVRAYKSGGNGSAELGVDLLREVEVDVTPARAAG